MAVTTDNEDKTLSASDNADSEGSGRACPFCKAGVIVRYFQTGNERWCIDYPGKCKYHEEEFYFGRVKTIAETDRELA